MRTLYCRLLGFAMSVMAAVCAARVLTASENNRKPTPANNATVVEHIERAFEEGFVVGPRRLQEAQEHLAQARRLASEDPRVDFALGLVLVRQGQVKQAIVPFEAAIEIDESYWPAWQAAIWTLLAEKRYEAGLRRLVNFATVVRASEKPDEVSEVQRDAARWIGKVIVSLSCTDDSKRLDELVAANARDVLKALGEELWDELAEGRDSITARDVAPGQAGRAGQSTDKHQQARTERNAARLEKDIEEAGKASENIEKDKQEWKRWLDDELAHYDKMLGNLERDFKFLDERALSLTQSMNFAAQELSAMGQALGTIDLRNTNALGMQAAQEEYLQRQNQYRSYQTDYNTTVGRMSEVVRAGAQAVEQRAGVIAEYEKETGDLVKKTAGLEKWSSRLKNQKQKLAVNPSVTRGNRTRTGEKKAPPPTFKIIMPFDAQGERERLLASFGPRN
jgi:tetratricopeptide (TPR) repeat protein